MVVVNERTGTIAITGNVEIAPVIVHVNGLSIQVVEPEPEPRPGQPVVSETEWTHLDTTDSVTVKISELIDALDQLSVPVREKIHALYALQRAGALRARIITEN